ncbi:hypothetical protein V6N13_035694 [Hibiscus sabdariffa]
MYGHMDESGGEVSSSKEQFPQVLPQPMPNGNVVNTLQTAESWDWKRVMAEDPNYVCTVGKSPVKYFLEEMHYGNSLRNTTTLGSEKERERVYDTIFRLPWRCEVLISVSLLRLLRFISVLVNYHANKSSDYVLEAPDYKIFDKLCQSFGGDVLETLFNSAEGLANCSQENMGFWIGRFVSDQALTMAFSNILMFNQSQAITLSTCIVAHNNALFALLVSNNFAEIKSNVFKRFSKDNTHSLAYSGYSSVDSRLRCSPSMQPSGMEILLDPCVDFNDLYHAHKLKSDDWYGTTKTCNLVCQ